MSYVPTPFHRVRHPIRSWLPCLLLMLSVLVPAAPALVSAAPAAAADGAIDYTFLNSATDGPNDAVYDIAVQPDGRVIIGGKFTSVNGETRKGIARLNADGTLDPSFAATSVENGGISALALQPDGKILIGGAFSHINGAPRDSLARLNADGTIDASFSAVQLSGFYDWQILSVVLQPDGKILVGGEFTRVNGERRSTIARLNADGTLDLAFAPLPDDAGNTFAVVRKLALQPDGKILVGGEFNSFNGTNEHIQLFRLNADGLLDSSFPVFNRTESRGISSIALQPDGKILIGGNFATIDGVRRQGIARLNADGALDRSFALPYTVYGGKDLALQADGKVLTAAGAITRLDIDGSPDASFATSDLESGKVWSIALQPDGKVLIGGDFSTVNGVHRPGLARLHNTFLPRLLPSPQMTILDPTQTFQLALRFDLSSMPADRVAVHLRFDPALLEVVDTAGNPATKIAPDPAVEGDVTQNQVDPVAGEIVFALTRTSGSRLSEYGTLASIRFRPKALAMITHVEVVRNDTRSSDLFRGETPLQAMLEHALVRIVPERVFIPLIPG